MSSRTSIKVLGPTLCLSRIGPPLATMLRFSPPPSAKPCRSPRCLLSSSGLLAFKPQCAIQHLMRTRSFSASARIKNYYDSTLHSSSSTAGLVMRCTTLNREGNVTTTSGSFTKGTPLLTKLRERSKLTRMFVR